MNLILTSIQPRALAAGAALPTGATPLILLALLVFGCWLLFSGGGKSGGKSGGDRGKRNAGSAGSRAFTLIVIGLLLGATTGGSAVIHKAIVAFTGAVSALSGLFH